MLEKVPLVFFRKSDVKSCLITLHKISLLVNLKNTQYWVFFCHEP